MVKKTEGTPPEPEPTKEGQVKETPEVEKDKEGTPSAIPEQYQGKTPEELAQILQEKERYIGDLSREKGELRKDLELYEQQSQTQTPQGFPQGPQFPTPQVPGTPYDPYGGYQGYQPQQPYNPYPGMNPWGMPQPQGPPQINYEDLDGSIEKKIQWHRQQEEQKRQQSDKAQYQFDMSNAYQEGRQRAYKSNPKLFKGIEKEVESGILEGIKRGMFYPSDLRNEETFVMAGRLARFRRNEFDYIKPETPPAMTPTHTEVPGTMKEEEMVPVELTPREQVWQKMTGLTDEEVKDVKKGGK